MTTTDGDGYTGARCPCGSTWFDLVPADDEDDSGFTMDTRGAITGYAGQPVCSECGEAWKSPRERLRVVPSSEDSC